MTTIFVSSPDKVYLYESVNKDLHSLSEWFQTNKLSLNVTKTNYILFNNSKSVDDEGTILKIANYQIKRKDVVKFLVTIFR